MQNANEGNNSYGVKSNTPSYVCKLPSRILRHGPYVMDSPFSLSTRTNSSGIISLTFARIKIGWLSITCKYCAPSSSVPFSSFKTVSRTAIDAFSTVGIIAYHSVPSVNTICSAGISDKNGYFSVIPSFSNSCITPFSSTSRFPR